MANLVGQQFGNYLLTTLLGGGGFADVYLGEHIHIVNMQAAIKVLTTQLTSEEIEKFRTEANTMAHLNHPNIVHVLDFGVEGGRIPYLVMTYAPNGTLHLSKGKQMLPTEILPYVKQIASALQYVHDKKLVHLDIKPENILLGQNNEVLLSDFGIAMVARSTGQPKLKDLLGTIDYMAPEHIQGKPRPASDQYALAIVVYEWLCDTCPFQGSTPRDIAVQHLVVSPPPLHNYVSTISPAVEQVVLKALSKEPVDRYESVLKFAEALEQAITMPVASTPPPPTVMGSTFPPTVPLNPPVVLPSVHPKGTIPIALMQPPPPVRVLGSNVYTYQGHSAGVYIVTWSPDNKRIASTSDDCTIQVWDAATGGNVFTYTGHAFLQVWSVIWSPNGKQIASAGADQIVHVWDAVTGNKLITYSNHSNQGFIFGSTYAMAWSPNGKYIASGGDDQTVQVWDTTTGTPIFIYRGHTKGINTVVWAPDSQRIASGSSGSDKVLQIWDATTGNNMHTYSNGSRPVYALAWSPNGKYVASASNEQTIQVWDVTTESIVHIDRGHHKRVRAITWSPDSTQIASGGDDMTVQIWDAITGNRVFTHRDHSQKVNTVAWSPDGRYIASASDDMTVRVWQAK